MHLMTAMKLGGKHLFNIREGRDGGREAHETPRKQTTGWEA